eukprot:TRINITY_DN3052_c3_g6_i1.p1 TRINITY_DN3052_c3_g6~~TRINITY_DN3052_c3_g6_i1.p1  ORF type:complete len:402 (-),score=136.55 TRINITY_DN3052_c3_g6_i1:48-1253(-)
MANIDTIDALIDIIPDFSNETQEQREKRREMMKNVPELEDLPLFASADHPLVKSLLESAEMENTVLERMETFKEHGNDSMAAFQKSKNKEQLQAAIHFYTSALKLRNDLDEKDDFDIVGILFSNRSQALLMLKHYNASLQDALNAISIIPTHFKSYHRASKAAIELERVQEATEFLSEAKRLAPADYSFLKTEKDLDELKQHLQKEKLEEEEEYKLLLDKKAKLEKLKDIGVKLGRPLIPRQRTLPFNEITFDDQGEMFSPILIMYPEYNQTDYLQNVHNKATIQDIGLTLFGPNSPPADWDTGKMYDSESVEFFFQLNWTSPYCALFDKDADLNMPLEDLVNEYTTSIQVSGKQSLVRLKRDYTLEKIVTHPAYITPLFPLLICLSKRSPFRKEYINRYK